MTSNQPDVLKNATCCYCRTTFNENSGTKEHVVARRFVPKGTLDRSWNLIVRACRPCNLRKSDLEDDLAVLSMQHYPFGNDPETDKLVSNTLEKASRTISRRTKKRVTESAEEHNFDFTMAPGLTMSV